MRWARFFFAGLLAILAQCLIPSAAHAKWLRAETRNFVIYSDGSDKELRRFSSHLERFDATTRWAFGVPESDNPNKLTVYFLASQDAVAKLAGDKQGMIAGFYSPRLDGTFAVSNRSKADDMWDLSGMTVLFHEYAHHFIFRHFSYAYPAWYVEGFAEYLSTATFADNGSWTLGKPAYHRAYSLLATEKVPIERLMFGNTSDLKSAQVGSFYGRSWLLVHMLSMKPEYKGKLKTYFALIGAGKPAREAAIEAFGDLALLDKSLDAYLGQKLRYIGSDKPIAADTNVTVTELNEAAGRLIAFRLARLKGNLDQKSLAELQSLAEANPDLAEAWYELAMSRRQLGRDEEDKDKRKAAEMASEVAIDKALAIDAKHVRANVLKASILFERLDEAGDENPAHWSNARQYLLTANTYAADDPLVLVEWYDSFAAQGRKPSKTAREGLARAFQLAPEVTDVRIKYAFDLADQGQYDDAIKLVEFLAQHPHYGKQGRELVDRLIRLRDGRPPPLPDFTPEPEPEPAKPPKKKGK